MAKSCTWCNKYIGDNEQYWFKNVPIDGKVYPSKEVFCSKKCSHEYPYSPTADKPNKGSAGCGIILLIIGAIIYFLLQGEQSTSEPAQSEKEITQVNPSQSNNSPNYIDGAKEIVFTNNTSETVYLAHAYYSNSSWEVHGYISIEPNSNKKINLPESFNDNAIYWYAIDALEKEWTGEDKFFCIKSESFDFYGNESENCQYGSKGFYKLSLSGTTTFMSLSR